MTTTEPTWFTFMSATAGRLIPTDPPRQMSGFRFARVFDAVSPEYAPQISQERGFITDDAERARVRAYLAGAPTIGDGGAPATNVLDQSETFPNSHHTDGVWIWTDQVAFYLDRLGIAPEPDFYRHIRDRSYAVGPVTAAVLDAAMQAVREWSAIDERAVDEFLAARAREAQRFPPEVAQRLVSMGWHEGRDIGDRIQGWLREWTEEFRTDPDLRSRWEAVWPHVPEQQRFLPIQLSDAARRVVYEFGDLATAGGGLGRGVTPPRLVIYPTADNDNAGVETEAVIDLAQWLGVALWPVGEVGDELFQDALVVDPDGRVFVVGAAARRYAGASFDEALTKLIMGIPLDPVPENWKWWHERG
ncbi:MAG TPA: SUKH-3 domain-containing protein [Micromonosporaceae bacterium]|jgi:hypothetical protein